MKKGHMKTPVHKDISRAYEKKDNYHKFISNGTVAMVVKKAEWAYEMDLWGK